DPQQLAKIQHLRGGGGARVIRGLYEVSGGVEALEARLTAIATEADQAIADGCGFLLLSDRHSNHLLAPIPSLLLVAAVHHHLIRQGTRMRVGLVLESGDVREVHHVATVLGYGASAVNPYLAIETVEDLARSELLAELGAGQAAKNLVYALGKGVLKIMAKMGISTIASYRGAQQFEALGLSQAVIERYFRYTTSKLDGIGLAEIARENQLRHASGYPENRAVLSDRPLPVGGEYQWRREGPPHLFNPETIFRLQHSTRTENYEIFKQYTALVNDQAKELKTIRGLLSLKTEGRTAIPIGQVESVASIVKRFSTGAMSYGSISQEAHEVLAIAMNRLGGRSNTGEGGEAEERLRDPERNSAIKQIASGRFGVTSLYLNQATDLQIKMAQGAKPGEGGQLPPNKVYPWIANTRHATAGVGLISPPPHHDIYSIEDLKQLIFDLKHANPEARIQVKLVSQAGVGTVAAGVAKALADVVLVSGHDGGTGASPLNSLKHAGTPWEIGLAEAQQTLRLNRMRGRIVLQVDGSLKTGRDVIIASLLGAEEFGFATAPLVVSGCIMMRVCHLDTCPVGVATQNPLLRERFSGKAEYVMNFMRYIAEEVREYLAELGYRSLDEIIGHSELLEVNDAIQHFKADHLDLSPLFTQPLPESEEPHRNTHTQDHELAAHFDQQLIELAADALENGDPVVIELDIHNTDRAVGTMLGHQVTKKFGSAGLPQESIDVTLHGTAGQSLGAFMPSGITIRLEGDANDYVGKGLSGGEIVIRPDPRSGYAAEDNVIAGNVIGYGATSGRMFIRGRVGERFMVRNSGATAVVEGVGDHALEYMTGGLVAILGTSGRNLGAGMSGGIAYVYRLDTERVNSAALLSGELELHDLDRADIEVLRDVLKVHLETTDSAVVAEMFENFDQTVLEFTKLLPRDYAAVMSIQSQHDAEQASGAEHESLLWQRILEVTDGRS
ncbi:MAG: glutamate synthase-related protein, partial [Microbacteriaceae bacterium]